MPNFPCWEQFKGTDLHELLKKKTQFDDPSTPEGKDAYLKAAKDLQQQSLSNTHDIYNQIGLKGYENKVQQPVTITPEAIHSSAKEQGINPESKDFMDKSEELTGKRHLDDMNEDELGKVNDYLKSPVQNEKPKIRVTAAQLEAAQPSVQENELPFGKGDNTGIAHEVRQARTYDTKSEKPIRGEGVTVEESIQHGSDLLDNGKDPQKTADKFLQDPEKNISYDGLSLVRAQNRVNVKATNTAEEQFGENSPQYNEALAKENKWYNDVVKPMQTEWSKIGQAQQSQEDIDTGTYSGLKRARTQYSDRPLSPQEIKEARGLSDKVQTLNKKVENLKQKLSEAHQTKPSGAKLSFEEKAKNTADKFRKTFKTNPITFKDENGNDIEVQKMGVGWNDLVEVGAKAIELSGKIADGVKAVIDRIKDEDWYKNLSDNDRNKFEKQLTEHFGGEENDIMTRFVDKKDNKFSPEDASDIWNYAKENYVDKGTSFPDMVQKVATDLGLKPQQVIDAISQPKGARNITNEMYRTNYERNKVVQRAKQWASEPTEKPVNNLLNTIAAPFRGLATLGHGHALLFTHAGMNLFDPQIAKEFIKASVQQFKLVYGNQKYYDQAVSALKNEPLYTTALRSGLAVNPDTIYDDWQIANNFLKRLKIQGNKGFLVLKMLRMELFKNEFKHLSDIEKTDKDALKNAAQNANHWTGTAGLKVSPAANALIFAPNLIVSKFARITTDPLKAVATFAKWNKASVADKAAAKIIMKKSARIAATYIAALAGNQALLSLSGSNQNINFSNPFKSDWLKFKAGGDKTVDVTSGMQSTLQLLTQLGALVFEKQKDVKADYYGAQTAGDALNNLISGYARRIASPLGSTIWDVASHKDFEGNTLPMYNDKPRAGKVKLTPLDYFMEKAPIPLSEGYRVFQDEMNQQGVDPNKTKALLNGALVAAVGSAGIKIGNEPKQKPSPFTDEDLKDKRVSWVKKDWGMELPNTVASSETITDEDKATKIMLDKYSPEKVKEYQKAHNENLFDILGDIHDNGSVYVKNYKDEKGNPKNEVSLKPPTTGEYDEKDLKNLSENEKKQVLRQAQDAATKKTKKEFNQ